MKREAAETLVDAIRKVLNGEKYLSPAMKEKMLDKFIDGTPISGGSPAELLSDRELEVFKLIGQGLGMRQIARELYLSVKTVETYREHIKVKLKIESADELRQQAIKLVQTWNLD